MKRIIFAALAIASLTLTAAADREELIQSIAAANAEMPVSAGMMGTMTSATVNGDTVIYNMVLDEMITGLSSNNNGYDRIKDIDKKYLIDVLSLMSDLVPETSDLCEMISDCDMYLKLQYANSRENTVKSITFTPDELFEITVKDPDYKALTEYLIRETQRGLPLSTSGLTITDYRKEGNDIVTYCIVDENVVSYENMKKSTPLIKDTYLQSLQNKSELSIIYSAYAMAKAGYNQVCIYKGSLSGDSFSYKVTSQEVLNSLE